MKSFKKHLVESKIQYLYHGTSSKNLDTIKKHGLQPGPKSEGHIYLTRSKHEAWDHAVEAVKGDPIIKKFEDEGDYNQPGHGTGIGGEPVIVAFHRKHPSMKGFRQDPELFSHHIPTYKLKNDRTAFMLKKHIPADAVSHVETDKPGLDDK